MSYAINRAVVPAQAGAQQSNARRLGGDGGVPACGIEARYCSSSGVCAKINEVLKLKADLAHHRILAR